MSASIQNAQNPPIAASQTAAAATAPSPGSSANVAAGSAQPTARSYAQATLKVSSPPIATSAAPIVAVGGPQSAQHGKSSSVSPVNGKNPIQPAVPTMAPIVNGAPSQGDHARKSSVTISAAGTSGNIPNGGPVASRAPQGLTFGAMSGSPAPAHAAPHHPQGASLNPQAQNPRIASPAHSPSPIPQYSGGKPNNLPGRPDISFGGGESAEANSRSISMPSQQNTLPQAQHLRRESSQSAHSDMSNQAFNPNRNFNPNGGRGRGMPPGGFNPHMGQSPQPRHSMPYQQRGGPNMAPPFQPGMRHPNSPYPQNRSPAMQPAQLNGPGMPYPYPHGYQQNPYAPQAGIDPYSQYYAAPNYGLQQSIHYPGIPNSPGRGPAFPQQMQGQYGMPGPYGPPQAPGMSRTPSQLSERPPSAVAPSTPAMTNVNHVSHTPTPSVGASPAPSSFTIPPKRKTAAIVIKNADGEVVDFNKKAASPAPPTQPRSPAIAATPTPPPRPESTHSRTESTAPKKTAEEIRAEFVKNFQKQLTVDKDKEDADKAAEAKAKADADAKASKEAEEKAAKEAKEKEEADAKAAKEAKDKADAEAAEQAKKDEEEKKRLEEEEQERMIAEMEAEMEAKEREEEEREKAYAEKKRKAAEEAKANEAERIKAEELKMRELEREAEEREAAKLKESATDKEEREALFASLKKNTQFGPQVTQQAATDSGASTPTAESATAPTLPTQPKSAKAKPEPLKLQTTKAVEPAQPTAGMNALKSARFLQVKHESINYPEGFRSPNPALNLGSKKGRQYDKDFLLQFQDVFKEKPSVDWDMKLKETVGDSSDSARPQSARPSGSMMGSRQPSRAGLPAGGAMGNFGQFGGRTLPPGTTSEQRFQQAQQQPRPTMTNPLASFVGSNRSGAFPMAPPMARTGSFQNMAQGPNSPRVGSSRGRGSHRGKGAGNKREEEQMAKQMPLTANLDSSKLKLERSETGWKPHSQVQAAPQLGAGHMPPDMVQRKVKAALNKMTPEKFDKIADQILEIAAQSKDETDGRTLRQVIQLTFEKACDEAHWASMYAKFCSRMLSTMSTDIKDENVKDKNGNPVVGGALFRKYLLNRCQEEFERGWEVNLPEKPEGENAEAALLSDEYYIAAAAKRKGLGLIQFIGELYKLRMLTLRIMHECVLKLLDFEGLPDESAIESLTKLLRTVGSTMQQEEQGPKMLQVYFERIEKVMAMESLPSRLKFMLLDVSDLRKAGWQSKDANKGPKTIAEIHEEAQAAKQAADMERMRSNQRGGPRPPVGRGDARSFSSGMMPPQDYPSGRVQMDDLRKLSKGASGRNLNNAGQLGPSMLGARSGSGRRGLGPGGLIGRGDESGASSRTATPPTQKEKESTTHVNSFSALAALENEGAGEVGSPPSTASSPPVQKAAPAVEAKDVKPSE